MGTVFKLAFYFMILLTSETLLAQQKAGNEAADQNEAVEDSFLKEGNYDASLADAQEKEAREREQGEAPQVRRFHEVLDELLVEFGYDVRAGQLKGLKNLAIRRVSVSDTLPQSYRQYLELLIGERIRENARIRLINCIPCKTKTSQLVDGKLRISSPLTNVSEMDRASQQLGIENFMDAVLVYHTTHMVLAFQIFDTNSKELVWARAYNSETVKSRYQKLAVDYKQVERARPSDEYVPTYRYLFGLGGASVPNVGGNRSDSSFAVIHFRGSEKFDNRRNEFGLMLNYYIALNSLLKQYPAEQATNPEPEEAPAETTEAEPKPFRSGLALYGLYAHNFLGALESYNDVRHGINFGAGIFLSTGYIAPTARVAWDGYFGRTFAVTAGGSYIAPSQILIGSDTVKTEGGFGAELVLAYHF